VAVRASPRCLLRGVLLGSDGHPACARGDERAADGACRARDSAGKAVAPRRNAREVCRRGIACRRSLSGASRYNSRVNKTPWRIIGDETGTCNCAWGCPCQFNALPTYGRCEALVALRIREGYYGPTKLD